MRVLLLLATVTGCGVSSPLETTTRSRVVEAGPLGDAGTSGVDAGALLECLDGMVLAGDFCVDETEVTMGAYGPGACVESPDHPAACVNWYGADAHCAKIGKRLCSAEEWTRACEGSAARSFPYGDAYVPGHCVDQSFGVSVLPVRSGCEGGYAGVFDLIGNVWEFTARDGDKAPYRGGSVFDGEVTCQRDDPRANLGDAVWNIGFRCCAEPH